MPEIKEIRLKELPLISTGLADKIKASGFPVRSIVFIEKAGRIPGYLLQARLGGKIYGIQIIRPNSWLKRIAEPLLPFVPKKIRIYLRTADLGKHQNNSERKVSLNGGLPSGRSGILIVDDAIDTGYSILSVVKLLLSNGVPRDQIRIAAFNTTLSARVVEPDFVCYPETIIFYPWSYDSKEKKEFQRIYSSCVMTKADQLFF
jgi:hypoxanthine phosphoribosyltransferase